MSDTGTAAPDRLLSVREAAEVLSCHPVTIRRLIAAGQLPAVRLGPRLLRVPAKAICALGQPAFEKP